MAGANPTLDAITNDASRGGLFTQSNVANPVEGVDVTGTTINDSTVTLTVSINGTVQTGTFTLNNPADQPVNLTFTGIGTSDTPDPTPTGGGDPVERGELINSNQDIRLYLESGNTVDIAVGALATDAELEALRMMIPVIPNIPTTFLQLTDTPTALGANGTYLGVTGGALAFTTPPNAPAWTGNSNEGDNVGSNPVVPASLILDSSSNLVLVNDGSNNITIRARTTAAREPATEPTPPSDAIDPPTQAQRTVRFDAGPMDRLTDIDVVSVTRTAPDGMMTTLDPMMDLTVDTSQSGVQGGSGSIIINEDAASPPGTYDVIADVETTNPAGDTSVNREMSMIDRFVPFFQSRSQFSTLSGATPEGAEFNNTTGFTSSSAPGSTLYVAIETDQLAAANFVTIGGFSPRVRTIAPQLTLTLAGETTPRTYNQYAFQAGQGVNVSNFRTAR